VRQQVVHAHRRLGRLGAKPRDVPLDRIVEPERAAIDGVRVVSAELVASMREPRGEGALAEMGLGLFRLEGGWVGHAGQAGGFEAELRFCPERGVGVAVLANAGAADVAAVADALARMSRVRPVTQP
jgi:CubicO group peptidase (beta-lactamase class C family)